MFSNLLVGVAAPCYEWYHCARGRPPRSSPTNVVGGHAEFGSHVNVMSFASVLKVNTREFRPLGKFLIALTHITYIMCLTILANSPTTRERNVSTSCSCREFLHLRKLCARGGGGMCTFFVPTPAHLLPSGNKHKQVLESTCRPSSNTLYLAISVAHLFHLTAAHAQLIALVVYNTYLDVMHGG